MPYLFTIFFISLMIMIIYLFRKKNIFFHTLLANHFKGMPSWPFADSISFNFNKSSFKLTRVNSGNYGSHPVLSKVQNPLVFTAIMPVSAQKYYYLRSFPKNHFIHSIEGKSYAVIFNSKLNSEENINLLFANILSKDKVSSILRFLLQKKFSSIIIKNEYHISWSFKIKKESIMYVKGIPEEVYNNPELLEIYLNSIEQIFLEFKF